MSWKKWSKDMDQMKYAKIMAEISAGECSVDVEVKNMPPNCLVKMYTNITATVARMIFQQIEKWDEECILSLGTILTEAAINGIAKAAVDLEKDKEKAE